MIETISGRYGTISFPSSDQTIGRSLRTYGEWAENEIRFLLKFLHPGDTVLDVGAYIGTHTLAFASAVGPNGKVCAFEPRPEIFRLLATNVHQNGLDNVVLRQAAVGAESGFISLPSLDLSAPENFGGLSVVGEMAHTGASAAAATAGSEIEMLAIDALELEACRLIKIDVEGAELTVLEGARQTIGNTRSILYCECNSVTIGIKIKEFYDSIGYLSYFHLADAFNGNNFGRVAENFFGSAREAALIGVHHSALPDLFEHSDVGAVQLLPVADADAIAFGLLQKPQFASEALELSSAGLAYKGATGRSGEPRETLQALQVLQATVTASAEDRRLQDVALADAQRVADLACAQRDELAKQHAAACMERDALAERHVAACAQRDGFAERLAAARSELDRMARHPWRPLKHYLVYLVMSGLAALIAPLSGRASLRFTRSAEKRSPWRFARPHAGATAERSTLANAQRRDPDSGRTVEWASARSARRSRSAVRLAAALRHPFNSDRRRKYRARALGSHGKLAPAARSAKGFGERHPCSHDDADGRLPSPFHVIPRYIDPGDTWSRSLAHCNSRIAIHLHLFYFDLLEDFVARFRSIPFDFDLFVSVPDFAPKAQIVSIEHSFRDALQGRARKIVLKPVPNRGRDIAPFIVEFGKTLIEYDIVGHFHTKKSPHNPQLKGWHDTVVDLLLGPTGNPGGHVAYIVGMLESDAKMVCAEGSVLIPREPTGWAGNYSIARNILNRLGLSIRDFPVVEFAEGSMLWARSGALRRFLELPLSYRDFPAEPIDADGTLAHALERLTFILAHGVEGDLIRLHQGDSVPDYRYFEEAQDFSSQTACTDMKLLAYYLPQFHVIPENDEWHGIGFTEWTKVRSANPLFRGHFQQRIPHPDVGYYLIDDGAVLRRQAADMKKAGVHGQVFYHYWFGGKTILEKPAQILLENTDIEMPFCFCWANENWTRRWDGSEDQILLQQEYSADDARSFVRYLLPFFRDARYITVDSRPVLIIYRPTLIPIMSTYLEIWRDECEAVGMERPYVVATLAAGATDPRDFGLDAGAERVLYDWTNGKVSDMTPQVQAYTPLRGRVFSYDRIKDHYMAQPIETAFTCFRSLVPHWDNTARYGAGAHLLHGSTPPMFQEWLELLIAQTRQALPPDRRFIFVNAWNEWAEGAYLEADTRYGYAYLNAIGRALSNAPFQELAADSRHALGVAGAADRARELGAMMMVVHRWGGGTEQHVADLAKALMRTGIEVLLTRVNPERPNWVVVEVAGAKTSPALGAFDLGAAPDDYARLMRRLHVRHLHIQHLAGFPEATGEWLQQACTTAGVPYDVSLHDYMMICPRIFMVAQAGTYCGEPPLSQCEACIATAGSPFGQPPVDQWRIRFGRLLSGARRCFVPNEDVAERFSRYFSTVDFTVRPHPEPRRNPARLKSLLARTRRGEPGNSTGGVRHVAIIGHLIEHKGCELVLRCARFAHRMKVPIRFTIVGETDRDRDFKALHNVTVLGRYNRSELLDIIEQESPDIAFLPSVCPETYSFTFSEAVAAGVYPVAFDRGAVGRRIRSLGWGHALPVAWSTDPQAIVRSLLEITPTPPPPTAFELAQGGGYPDLLRDYYELDWKSKTMPGSGAADAAGEQTLTKGALLEARFAAPGREVALFVTHSPDGLIKAHVPSYLSALADAEISVYVIVAADLPSQFKCIEKLPDVTGVFVRRNEGYDFAAWAHIIRKYPEFREVDILYLVNDSVVGPLDSDSLSRAIGRIRNGSAQLYGMTENFEKSWHLQSYFLAIKQAALKSSAFADFFDSIEVKADKEAVIDSYELAFATKLVEAGFRAEALFTVPSEQNPTIYHWRELVENGFPFVKAQVARDHIQGVDREAVREYLKKTGLMAPTKD